MGRNQGQGAARNRAIPLASSPLTLFVGDDMIPHADFVRGHLAAHRRYKAAEVAILGRTEWSPRIPRNTLMDHIDGIGAQQFSYHYLQDEQEYDFRHFYTSNISLKTRFLQSLDRWFDTDFYLYGYEDTELGYRLANRGMRIVYQSALGLEHSHYYNIWTFSARQRKSGQMANVLLDKHPRLRISPVFRFHYTRVLNLFRMPRIFRDPHAGAVRWHEDLACRLASMYEWEPIALLDRYYLAVLDYFYYDGFITGLLEKSPRLQGMRAAHADRYLTPSLRWFMQETGSSAPRSYPAACWKQ
jgi:hypothetical protein